MHVCTKKRKAPTEVLSAVPNSVMHYVNFIFQFLAFNACLLRKHCGARSALLQYSAFYHPVISNTVPNGLAEAQSVVALSLMSNSMCTVPLCVAPSVSKFTDS